MYEEDEVIQEEINEETKESMITSNTQLSEYANNNNNDNIIEDIEVVDPIKFDKNGSKSKMNLNKSQSSVIQEEFDRYSSRIKGNNQVYE
jgi:hypothetical protein